MKKACLLLAFVVFLSMNAFAQGQDVLTLKNGTTITGTILERSNDKVKIRTNDGDVFVYRTDELRGTDSKSSNVETEYEKPVSKIRNNDYKGYNFILETGIGYTAGVYYHCGHFALNFINGYTFSRHFFLGGGVGLNAVFVEETRIDVPIFVNFRYSMLKKKISPYLSFNAGANVACLEETVGFYFEPAIGVLFRFNKRHALNLGLGVGIISRTFDEMYHYTRYTYYGQPYTDIYFEELTALNIHFGLRVGYTF